MGVPLLPELPVAQPDKVLNVFMKYSLEMVFLRIQTSYIVGQCSRTSSGSGDLLAVHGICQGGVETQRCQRFQHLGPSVQPTLQVDEEDLNI